LRGAEAADYERQIRARIADLGLADNVVLTGFLPDADVARRLVAADIAVLPFNRGATLKSGTLIACLRFGLPVIATQGGQLGELRHGDSVWLVPPRDSSALAAALRALSADPERRRRIGAVGATIATQFDWTTIAARHRELYLTGATGERTFGSRPRR
jgi:glycosyltransferase involved in cell wall biosynthesis